MLACGVPAIPKNGTTATFERGNVDVKALVAEGRHSGMQLNEDDVMQVREIMTENPACCGPENSVQEAARLMVQNDCGEVPVVDQSGHPVGVITDRDIACRCVAQGKDHDTPVSEVMSAPVVTVTPETDLEECCAKMEENQVRRIPVVDEEGRCCGIVSQADVARVANERDTAGLVRDVSEPTRQPANKHGCC